MSDDHTTFDPSNWHERPSVIETTFPISSCGVPAVRLLAELRPLVAAALDWDDARRAAQAAPASDEAWARYTAAADVTRERLDALSEDAHVWARGEALVDDRPATFAIGPAPESVFDCEEGDPLGDACCGSGFLVYPGDRAVAFALVAADLARHLALQPDRRNGFEDDAEAREALSAFYMVRSAMIQEAAQ